MSEQMVRTARLHLDELDLEDFSLPREAESWSSMSDSGEFSASNGEVPLDHTECQLAMGYNPEKSDSYRLD